MDAIVIGRSNLVGRPLVQLLLNENATVTIAHSRSRNLSQLCARADIVYAAVGKPEIVRGGWIKPGATVIDVGTTVCRALTWKLVWLVTLPTRRH